jgi:hypothetical protein
MPPALVIVLTAVVLAISGIVGTAVRRGSSDARDLRRAGHDPDADRHAAARRAIGTSSWMRIGGGGF